MTELKQNSAEAHAFTVHVADIHEWLKVVMKMEQASRFRCLYGGNKILGPRWLYRGQADAKWSISSSFEREVATRKTMKGIVDKERFLWCKEQEAINHFRQWAAPHDGFVPSTKGEWLALMRHYRIPSRLVDFTEIPVIALGMAIDDGNKKSDFAVWAVQYTSFNSEYANKCLNEQILKSINTPQQARGKIKIDIADTQITEVLSNNYDRVRFEALLSMPATNNDKHNLLKYVPLNMNKRQKLQRGLFLVSTHLSCKFMPLLHDWTSTQANDLENKELHLDIDSILTKDGKFSEQLNTARMIKFVFDGSLKNDVASLLQITNIGKRTLYGDIEQIAEETTNILTAG